MKRPPRRAVLERHSWPEQVVQYDRPDVPVGPGVHHWQVPAGEVVVAGVPVAIECLLYRSYSGPLAGILNYYPDGSPYGDRPGDFFVVVDPAQRRRGVASALLAEADSRWRLDLSAQSYSNTGWALALAYHHSKTQTS